MTHSTVQLQHNSQPNVTVSLLDEQQVESKCLIYLCCYPTDADTIVIKTTNVLHSYQFKARCKAEGIRYSVHTRDITGRDTEQYASKKRSWFGRLSDLLN